MASVQRGGQSLVTGKIGRVNCIRQQLMMPGEMMNISVNGNIRLTSLRERDVMRINAHLAIFTQPVRWCEPNWVNYVKEGPDTATALATTSSENNWHKYGIGAWTSAGSGTHLDMFKESLLNIGNSWYKWPEDADITVWPDNGMKAVPLSKPWSRVRNTATPDDTDDYTVASATNFDVRDLAETEARFRAAMKRDVVAMDDRWMEILKNTWSKSDPSREIDKVPLMLDQVEVGVNPREIPATDGNSLGVWQSLYDFNVNHQVRGITAPEHMIVSYMLTIRFPAITESCHPLATDQLDWWEMVADPEYLSSAKPVEVQRRDLQQTSSSTSLGYLPAGWQWRCDHDVIDERIDVRNTFPYMNVPTTQAECRDATRIKDAFRSSSLGDYLCDVFISEDSNQPIGTSRDSYFSGMLDDTRNQGNNSDEFPYGGKML